MGRGGALPRLNPSYYDFSCAAVTSVLSSSSLPGRCPCPPALPGPSACGPPAPPCPTPPARPRRHPLRSHAGSDGLACFHARPGLTQLPHRVLVHASCCTTAAAPPSCVVCAAWRCAAWCCAAGWCAAGWRWLMRLALGTAAASRLLLLSLMIVLHVLHLLLVSGPCMRWCSGRRTRQSVWRMRGS